ncbi:hypothetical protein [Vibrio coralliilyticus]|uniref:Uncharacterized protein n=1 Tax=Vibrio coralliilyticus TaxID=190893 RepID=A0AAP6ZPW4_9VIBR|nr:hypothetical protein [Vibrio coralliilyticus]NOI32026.1 hypothetical protein [Vibrio coralliilyticus]NOJ25227.1 hypothetical protein [Vibrio coralliilyticus]
MAIKYLYTEGNKACENQPLPVSLNGNGLISGHIHKVKGGYQYQSQKGNSEVMESVKKVQGFLFEQSQNS